MSLTVTGGIYELRTKQTNTKYTKSDRKQVEADCHLRYR